MDHYSNSIGQTQDRKWVFVTGATGLLGSNLVRELTAQGCRVRALVRSPEKARRYLSDVDLEIIMGDMQRVEAFAEALTGCFAVFHTAAYFREYYEKPSDHGVELDCINVHGTLALMREADQRGVACFVHTSSTGTIGTKSDGSAGDEDTMAGEEQLRNLYFRSKVEADRRIRAWQPQHGMRVLEILPGLMWGPGDAGPTATGKMVLDFVARKLPAIPEGGTNMVDARDVAQAMWTGAQRARHGSRFIVAGEFRTVEQVLRELEALTRIRGPKLKLPFPLMLGAAWLDELRVNMLGGKLMIPREGLRTLRLRPNASSARARRELNVTFRPFTQTLADTLAWYRRLGFIT
jgi:dihydroflavonol-4-reductase